MKFQRVSVWSGWLIAWLLSVSLAGAHFVWIETERGEQGLAVKSGFGEIEGWDPDLVGRMKPTQFRVRTLSGLESVEIPLDEKQREFRTTVSGKQVSAVVGACDFGVLQLGGRPPIWLRYTAKSLVGPPSAWHDRTPTRDFRIEVMASVSQGEVLLKVLHLGQPLAGAKLKTLAPQGEVVEVVTDPQGEVRWKLTAAGTYACYVGSTTDTPGEHEGKAYTALKDYTTLTFTLSAEDIQAATHELPSLPEAVTSFGGAAVDGWLYVYSGHIGGVHEHSIDNLSKSFRRLNLAQPGAWEELPMGQPLQGVALAVHRGQVIRVGGMTAKNQWDEDEDLHSVAEVARFNPATKTWTALPSLPEPRSTHDCTVDGDWLYVAGGWNLRGKGQPAEWHKTAWRLNLSQPGDIWEALPEPPFQRRALSIAVSSGKLYVVGGLQMKGRAVTEVDILDLASGVWSKGPSLPEAPLQGFAPAAVVSTGRLFASPIEGVLYELQGDAWAERGRLSTPRYMHRLVAPAPDRLVAVAGVNKTGHLASVEVIELKK